MENQSGLDSVTVNQVHFEKIHESMKTRTFAQKTILKRIEEKEKKAVIFQDYQDQYNDYSDYDDYNDYNDYNDCSYPEVYDDNI